MERQLIDKAQALHAELAETLKALIKIQKDAGRGEAQNACYLVRKRLGVWHGKATKQLFKHFPEFANDVVTRGPGR